MTEEVEFKRLPKFDRHVDYWQMHNATSEAVLQLQMLVHELREEVAELKADAKKPAARTTRAKSTTASK